MVQYPEKEPTLNQKGFTFQTKHPLFDYWVDTESERFPLLEIGCAYGFQTLLALEQGHHVIAMDMDSRHLEKLAQRISDPYRKHCQIQLGKLPEQLDLPDASVSSILCSEVLHFLPHHELIASFWEFYRVLRPGGKLIISALGFENPAFSSADTIALLRNRWRENPLKFSGWIKIIVVLKERMPLDWPDRALAFENMPEYLQFFISDQLRNILQKLGFNIVICRTSSSPRYKLWASGNGDQVQLVASKPQQ